MPKIVFRIGNFPVHLFGLFIALGILVGLYVLKKEAIRKNLDEEKIFDLAIYSIIAAIIGARIYYVIAFNPGSYLKNPLQIFMIQNGGLSIQGSLIAAIGFVIIYTRYKKLSFWKIADTFAPALILGQAIGRIGCDVFGVAMQTAHFWGIRINNQLLHPAQIYESILNYILFAVLWNLRDKVKYNGQLFLYYLIGFSVNRGAVEFFRTNPIVIKPFTIAHVTSLIIIIVALFTMAYLSKQRQSLNEIKINTRNKLIGSFAALGMIILSIITYYSIY
jgi:phosphatidylglycerol:prolipoprotein diacylglycerol transferase